MPNSNQVEQDNTPTPSTNEPAAAAITQAVRDDNLSGVVTSLRGLTVNEIRSTRTRVHAQANVWLEQWFAERMNRTQASRNLVLNIAGPALSPLIEPLTRDADAAANATAEEGLRRLWPALPLIERLELYDEGYREIEQAQIDVIRAASAAQRTQARNETERLEAIYSEMNPEEEYEARILIDDRPEAKYRAARQLLTRAPGIFTNVEDPVFDAILGLTPTQRQRFYNQHLLELSRLLYQWQFRLVGMMARGTEVDALIARLRLATESRIDDQAAVQTVVDRAVALLSERRQLRIALASPNIPEEERTRTEARLTELEDLDRLLRFQRGAEGELAERSFMGLVSGARDASEAFGTDAQRLAEFATDQRRYAFEMGKQRILLAAGDVEAIRAAIFSVQAPPIQTAADATPDAVASRQHAENLRLREDLLRDREVAAVIGNLTGFNESLVRHAAEGDRFDATHYRLSEAHRDTRWGEFFQLTMTIARNDEWRRRYEATANDPFGLYARVQGEAREIMLMILRDRGRHLPLGAILRFTSDVDVLRVALANIGEEQRERLRLGWSLAREQFAGPLTEEQQLALQAFQNFEAQVRGSQTTLGILDRSGFEEVLSTALGAEPTADELTSGAGRYRAAALMYERQEARLRLGRGDAAHFTESDETMDAAAREFGALWLHVRDQHTLSMVDFAALSALHQQFLSRAEEFSEANNIISELAGMVAATIAGIVVIVATGGTATPGVIALAAVSGAGARVVTREMFGEDYYNAMGNEAARDALLGAVDGALAVVSGRLAARGAELVGLGGRTLTGRAWRIAGSVAEEATQPFARRVASGTVESALDGLLSGTVSEAFSALTDERTWRQGIMHGLVRVGQSALVGGLVGLGTGGVVGAVTPSVSRGARQLWDAAVGRNLENAASRAGASETLAAARAAARRGDIGDVNRLAAQLEPHLSPQQMLALREQLYSDLHRVLGHPPGTARPSSPAQERLLRESGAAEGTLTPQHLDAEMDIIRRSEPQPSRMAGYVDEVDLGNGHTWRRQNDGTWCRFSNDPTQCLVIPNAPRLSATARARAEAAFHEINRLRGFIAEAHQVSEEYPSIVDKLMRERRPGQRTINVDALTSREREVLEQVFSERIDIGDLTLADLQTARSRPGEELSRLYGSQERAIGRLRDSTRPLWDRIRNSMRERIRDRIIRQANGLDMVSGLSPQSTRGLEVDHIVPLRDIFDMPGFAQLAELDWDSAVSIAHWEPNLRAVDGQVNNHRQNKSWAEPFRYRDTYSRDALERIIETETRNRSELQRMINRRLAALGRTLKNPSPHSTTFPLLNTLWYK